MNRSVKKIGSFVSVKGVNEGATFLNNVGLTFLTIQLVWQLRGVVGFVNHCVRVCLPCGLITGIKHTYTSIMYYFITS